MTVRFNAIRDTRAPAQPKLDHAAISAILKAVDIGEALYREPLWRIMAKGDGYLIQLTYLEADVERPNSGPKVQQARKWYVSPFSTETEVVRTAYKAVLCSLEHRLGEHFRYQGRRVYDPHRPLGGE